VFPRFLFPQRANVVPERQVPRSRLEDGAFVPTAAKRWRNEAMSRRWVALAVAEAPPEFRRVKSQEPPRRSLRPTAKPIASVKKVA
jgi:hypothetical protein